MGTPIDVAIVINQTRGHLSCPSVGASVGMVHEILTVDMQTAYSQSGLHLEKKFTDYK